MLQIYLQYQQSRHKANNDDMDYKWGLCTKVWQDGEADLWPVYSSTWHNLPRGYALEFLQVKLIN